MVVCNSAYRSSMGTGILERKGIKNPRNLEGGSQAWIAAGLPVYEGEKTPEAGLDQQGRTQRNAVRRPKEKAAKPASKPKVPDEGC